MTAVLGPWLTCLLLICCLQLIHSKEIETKTFCSITITKADDFGKGKVLKIRLNKEILSIELQHSELQFGDHIRLIQTKNRSDISTDIKLPAKYDGVDINHKDTRLSGYLKNGFFHGMIQIVDESYLVEEPEVLNQMEIKTAMYLIQNDKGSKKILSNTTIITYNSNPDVIMRSKCPILFRVPEPRVQPQRQTMVKKMLHLCTVELIADHTFYEEFGPDEDTVIMKMFKHVSLADIILRRSDFDGNGAPDGIGLMIRKVTIYKDNQSPNYHLQAIGSTLAEDYITNVAKRKNNVCLVICFCHRVFEGATVGVAFVPNANNHTQFGGICEKSVTFSDGTVKKMNVLAISTKSFLGKRVPDAMTSSTVIHEIGHSFGSGHDDPGCSLDRDGKYIMHPQTLNGLRTNNFYFSPCSLKAINGVIRLRRSCLETYPSNSLCGNGIREGDEECDCGLKEVCHVLDPCCNQNCTYKRELEYQCSYKTDPCCTEKCRIEPEQSHRVCKYHTGLCSLPSVCDGVHHFCPRPSNASINESLCEARECYLAGLKTCNCAEDDCNVCCFNNSSCGNMVKKNSSITLPYGSSCMGGNGTCTIDGKCAPVTLRQSDINRVIWFLFVFVPIFTIILICCVLYCRPCFGVLSFHGW